MIPTQTRPKQAAAMSIDEFVALSGTSRTIAYKELKRNGEIAGIKAICIGKRILLSRSRVYEVFGIRAQDPADAL